MARKRYTAWNKGRRVVIIDKDWLYQKYINEKLSSIIAGNIKIFNSENQRLKLLLVSVLAMRGITR